MPPRTGVLENLRGVDVCVNLSNSLVNVPPGLRVDDGSLQIGPPLPAQRRRRRMGEEKPLVLACGDRQEVKLGGPVEDGADQVVRGQLDPSFFENLTDSCAARILSFLDATPNREPPGSLRLILIMALRQQDTSLIVKQEDAGGLPVGIAVRVHRPVECAHASRVAR